MTRRTTVAASFVVIIVCVIGTAVSAPNFNQAKVEQFQRLPQIVESPSNPMSPARVALGKALFFDPRLSGSQSMSCASCHNPSLGWSDGLPTAIGQGMSKLRRATPTIVNSAYGSVFMWDGRKHSLEDQALGPIQAKDEMNMDMTILLERLSTIKGYREMFDHAYPGEGITPDAIAKAIASFERTVVSTNTPFDRWRRGEQRAVSDAAKRGFELFLGKADCVACHQGFNFTDEGFHNIGVKTVDGMKDDDGRYEQLKLRGMKGAFKTPTLREVALTAPYMHNGIYTTLEEVVDHYDRGGDVKDNLDISMRPLKLSTQEKIDLVEFMKTLTSERLEFAVPRLPQ